ncbi:MAG: 23S rRNA (guanosine(2251)-2'-O)-methyltransferase RlmB [Candidatus Thiodiazotropha sp. (ex Monitilora ramsayi)]|nr:23S rRNA (guanosine(2251)-2'-O)-methyltransferase RlmB [Candidatus Thiodiazotropha sp. (ex Monitilora ramsayi)]
MSDRGEWIYGLHSVRAALEREAQILQLWVDSGRQDQRIREILKLSTQAGIPIRQVTGRELDELAQSGRHQGVIASLRQQQTQDEPYLKAMIKRLDVPPFLLILDEVQDPHNLGACLRTAEGAGVQAVITSRDRSVGLTPTVRKVASGATESIPFIQVTNLARTMKWLKAEGVWLVGTAGEADQGLYKTDLVGPLALVMGGEGKGLRRLTRENCDLLVSLPMAGSVESLNVSVATGVALYEAVRQRRLG